MFKPKLEASSSDSDAQIETKNNKKSFGDKKNSGGSSDEQRKFLKKREEKAKMKEAREMGLPSGITFEEVEKFNKLLRTHGDSRQNQKYFE